MAPSSKKSLTYSKHGSQADPSALFKELNQRTPQKIRSSLPSPTGSPRRSLFLSARTSTPMRDGDVFDIPSSDEEYPRSSRLPSTKKHASSKSKVSALNTGASTELLSLSFNDSKPSDPLPHHAKKKRKTKHASSASPTPLQGHTETQNTAYDSEHSSISVHPPTNSSSRSSISPPKDLHPAVPIDTPKPFTIDVWDVPSSDSDSLSHKPPRNLNSRVKAHESRHQNSSVPAEARQQILHKPSQKNTHASGASLPSTPKRAQQEAFDPVYDDSPRSVNQSIDTPRAKGISTPKQENLWDKILFQQNIVATPSHHIKLLNLGRTGESNDVISSENAISRNKGLVDALKPAAQQSSPIEDPGSEVVNARAYSQELTSPHKKKLDNNFTPRLSTTPPDFESHELDTYGKINENPAGNNSHRLTYGGQRSYLEDSEGHLENLLNEPLDIETGLELPLLGLDLPMPSLPFNNKNHAKIENNDAGDDEASGVKTIFDLKAAGGMEHFTDEVNEIIDDLNDEKSALSRKRMAVLDLHQKLLKPGFRSRLIHSAYPPLIFNKCSIESDLIFGTISASSLNLVLGPYGDSYNASQFHQSDCLSFLATLLDEPRDIGKVVKGRQYNMSKISQESIESFRQDVISSSFWKEKGFTVPSPRSLGLITIETFVRRLRGQGNADPLLNSRMLIRLLDILESDLETIRDEPPQSPPLTNMRELETVLSILEACTINAACALDELTWTQSSLSRLIKVLESAIMFEDPSIRRLVARLSLNLANGNENNAKMFASESFVGNMIAGIVKEFGTLHTKQDKTNDLDVLLLSLGAMLNLAECSERARQQVIGHDYKQLETLVKVFLLGRKQAESADSLAAVQANVAYGWLSVLLGNLCQSKNIKKRIAKLLPGSGLKPLIDAVEEFIGHHKAADQTDDGNESYAMFTQRLEGVAGILRAMDV